MSSLLHFVIFPLQIPPSLPYSRITNQRGKQWHLRCRRHSRSPQIHSSAGHLPCRPTHYRYPRGRRYLRLRRHLASLSQQTRLLLILRHGPASPRLQTRPAESDRVPAQTARRLGRPDDRPMPGPDRSNRHRLPALLHARSPLLGPRWVRARWRCGTRHDARDRPRGFAGV